MPLPQATRVAFGKMWARPAVVPGVMSPHYLDSSQHMPSASWPEVGRRVLLPHQTLNPYPYNLISPVFPAGDPSPAWGDRNLNLVDPNTTADPSLSYLPSEAF